MAAFDADILLDVLTGPAERQVRKLETRIDRLDRKASDIDIKFDVDDREIRRADRLLNNLERTRRVKLRVDEQVNRSSGGTSTSAGLLPGLVAGSSASAGITAATKKLDESLSSVVEKTKQARIASASFAVSQREVAEAAAKLEPIQGRIAANESKIKELTKQRNIAAGQAKAIQTKLTNGQIKNADAIKRSKVQMAEFTATASDLSRKISDAEASQRGLNRETEKYARLAKGLPSTGFRAPGVPPGGGGGGRRGGGGGGNAAAAAAGGAFGGLKGNIATTIASLVGLQQAIQETGRIITATLERTQGEQRIRALSQGFDSYTAVLERSNAAAEKFNISQNQANAAFGQLYGRLRPLGLTLEEVNTVYEGFNTAAILSGTTASEASGAMLQLSQALGAGALRGEEFNSVAEQTPAITRAIADQLGVPIGQLKALAKEGKITSAVVVEALAQIKRDGADRLASALDSPNPEGAEAERTASKTCGWKSARPRCPPS